MTLELPLISVEGKLWTTPALDGPDFSHVLSKCFSTDFLLPTLLLSISGVPISFGTGFLQVYSLFIKPERCQTFCCFDHCAVGWFSLSDDKSHKDKKHILLWSFLTNVDATSGTCLPFPCSPISSAHSFLVLSRVYIVTYGRAVLNNTHQNNL